jgi:hypothetical protein
LIFNTFRVTYYYVNNLHDSFSICEANRISTIKTNLEYYFTSGLILYISVSVLFLFVLFLAEIAGNNSWKRFHDYIKKYYNHINDVFKRRYIKYHIILNQKDRVSYVENEIRSYHNVKIMRRYGFRLLIILLICILLYCISMFIIAATIESLLVSRVQLFNLISDNREEIMDLSHFMLDSVMESKNISLSKYYSVPIFFADSYENYLSLESKLRESRKELFKSSFQELLSTATWNMYFNEITDSDSALRFGIIAGYTEIEWESHILASLSENSTEEILMNYFEKIKAVVKFYNATDSEVDHSSLLIAENEYAKLEGFMIFSVLIVAFIVIGYFYYFFTKEQRILEGLEEVMQMFVFK